MNTPLYYTLKRILKNLSISRGQLVLVESCTAGLAAAELGSVPGISDVFCGSQVVYQTSTKNSWLQIDVKGLEDAQRGPVSAWASRELVDAILHSTPGATIAAAVTGHLGPNAPADLDGAVFFAARHRGGAIIESRIQLDSPAPVDSDSIALRAARQREATHQFLEWIDFLLDG